MAPLIVRTGQLNLEVAVLDDALAAAERAVTAAGGYVAASQRQGDDENAGAMVTYRIPVERWEATLAALRKVGAKVLSEQTGSEEVTSQVVDLGARLANLRATESALQAIMAKATKIPDILEVQAQLTGVRQEIEQLTAQKQSLEERAALATLTVGFSLPPAVAVTQVQEGWDPASEVDRAAATLVGLGQGVGERRDLVRDRPAAARPRPRDPRRRGVAHRPPLPAAPGPAGAPGPAEAPVRLELLAAEAPPGEADAPPATKSDVRDAPARRAGPARSRGPGAPAAPHRLVGM